MPKVIGPSDDSLPLIQAFFSLTIAATLSVLSFLKFKPIRTRTLFGTYIDTFAFTILLLFVSGNIVISMLVFLIGVFVGIGQLSFLAHFWKTTSSEERGRIGGLIGFVTLPIYFVLSNVVAESLDLSGTVILAAALSLVPIVATLFRNQRPINSNKKRRHLSGEKNYYSIFYSLVLFLSN